MFREPIQPNNQERIQIPSKGSDDFDNENLVNAFDLLLRIDMRVNPQNYIVKKNNQNQND